MKEVTIAIHTPGNDDVDFLDYKGALTEEEQKEMEAMDKQEM